MEKDFNIFLEKTETEAEEIPIFKEYAIDFKTGLKVLSYWNLNNLFKKGNGS